MFLLIWCDIMSDEKVINKAIDIIKENTNWKNVLHDKELCVYDIAVDEFEKQLNLNPDESEKLFNELLERGLIYEPVLGFAKVI